MTARVEAALLAGVLALAAVLFAHALDRAPNYDEGVYLASDDALRAGQDLGADVFASQPPGFYLLLRAATSAPGDSVPADRGLFVVLALLGVAGAWALARTLVSPAAGVVAAAALAVAPAYAGNAARVAADVPAMALALIGLAALALSRERESTKLAAAAGVVLALAVGVKLLAVVALVPAAVLVLGRLRTALAAAAGAAAAALLLLAPLAPALDELWGSVVGFHEDARSGSLRANASTVVHTLHPRLAWPLLVLASAVVAVARAPQLRRTAAAWLWLIAALAFLSWHRPLLDHHFALLAAAGSVAAGTAIGGGIDRLRGRTALAAAGLVALVVAAAAAQQWRATDRLAAPDPDVERAAELAAAATAPDEPVVTDLPIVAHLAGRTIPGELVDTSAVRFAAGSLEPEDVLQIIDEAGVRLVVVGREFRKLPRLLLQLERTFPQERRVGEITLLERDRAAARAARAAARE